jgi:ATP-binding cassette, subfamily F, member 3
MLSCVHHCSVREQTNHLDSAAKKWLGKYVSTYEGTVVTVSHDEPFLEALRCTSIAEVANCKLEVFKVSHSTVVTSI